MPSHPPFVRLLIAGLMLTLLSACQLQANKTLAQWVMVDVNSGKLQGDAHLLLAEDKVFLIDAGFAKEAKRVLIPELQQRSISHIHRAFLSHPHRDHYSGFAAILDAGITIDHLYYNLPPKYIGDCCYKQANFLKHLRHWQRNGVTTHAIKAGDAFKLGDTTLKVLHAQTDNLPKHALDVNDLSLIMRWQVGAQRVLFTGDLNRPLGQWLADHKADALSADILKVPHHGGYGIAPNAFFDAVGASQFFIPSPRWVWCGKRGKQARDYAKQQQIPTWINGIHGSITTRFYQQRFVITAQKNIATSASCEISETANEDQNAAS